MPTTKQSAAATTSNDRAHIPESTQMRLWLESGGYCEFDGCPKYLYEDGVTLLSAKLAQIAHIVAAKTNGPRGDDPLPLDERNEFHNLMLVCYEHHRLFDHEYVDQYPVQVLREFKDRHEERIRWAMSAHNHRKTTVIKLLAQIGSETPVLSDKEVRRALFPSYPADRHGIIINLANISPEKSANHWQICAEAITEKTVGIFSERLSGPAVDHLSVFALAPIPLLIHLGRRLGNKIPCDIYQKHRIGENWVWKTTGTAARFKHSVVRPGQPAQRAALLLSLSGSIDQNGLPTSVVADCPLYELTLDGQPPGLNFLNTLADLQEFRLAYQGVLSRIRADNPAVSEILLFPAIPPAVAVTCGRELLEKAHPSLEVYDFDKSKQNWTFALKVN